MESEVDDILRPLTDSELEYLLKLYEKEYVKASYHYIWLHTHSTWIKQLKTISHFKDNSKSKPFKKYFYTHRSGNLANGTYISLHWDLLQSVQFYSFEPSCSELKECLLKTKRIDWKNGPLIAGVLFDYYDAFLKEILQKVGAVTSRVRECHCFCISSERVSALKVPQLPEGYTLRTLTPADANLVHSTWANNKEGSLDYIHGLTLLNKTIGLVRSSDHRLVGWIFQNDFNGLGILEIISEERRKGFGELLATNMTRDIGLSQYVDVLAFVVKENTNSTKMLQKIGFKFSTKTLWIQCAREFHS